MISAASFVESSYDSLIVRVYKEVGIVKAHFFDRVDQEFEGDALKPTNVAREHVPRANAAPSIPTVAKENTDSPVGGHINEKVVISNGTVSGNGTESERVGKGGVPPTQGGQNRRGGMLGHEIILLEVGNERGEGGEVGAAEGVDKGGMA